MTEIEFKDYIDNYLNSIAKLNGITNLNRYYENTDLQMPEINQLQQDSIQQVFAQFILHCQNGTLISNIVNFKDNYNFLKELTCQFNPKDFLNKFHFIDNTNRDSSVSEIVNALRYDEITNPNGLKWNSNKSKKKDAIVTRFSNSLIDGAIYFSKFKNKDEVITDLKKEYSSDEKLIKYAKGKFKHGFSVALCCDFLKELSSDFDLPKPDVHIMDVMAKFKGYELDYYKGTDTKAYKCISDFKKVVEEIKKQDPPMTVYKLDRQIWLCCTGNFFLDNKFGIKDRFLKQII